MEQFTTTHSTIHSMESNDDQYFQRKVNWVTCKFYLYVKENNKYEGIIYFLYRYIGPTQFTQFTNGLKTMMAIRGLQGELYFIFGELSLSLDQCQGKHHRRIWNLILSPTKKLTSGIHAKNWQEDSYNQRSPPKIWYEDTRSYTG